MHKCDFRACSSPSSTVQLTYHFIVGDMILTIQLGSRVVKN
jgi:hypothetical protein